MRGAEASRQARVDWMARAILAGFSGAVAMLFAFLLAYALALAVGSAPAPEPLRGWFYALAHNPLTDFAGDNLYVMAGAHVLIAVGLALLYARYAEPLLGGPGWLRGLAFALVPWLLSILVVLPLGGGGFLGTALGAGPLPVLGNLILHLTYGATLGAIYGPLGDLPADSWLARGPADEPEAVRQRDVLTVRWIAGGLASGLVAALVALNFGLSPAGPRSGLPGAAVLLSWSLLGGAFGALLGSLVGAAPPAVRRAATAAAEPEPMATPEVAVVPADRRRRTNDHSGAMTGALLGTVALGPLGMPIGAVAGGVVDALRHGPPEFPSHTHDTRFGPCYDGCPAWRQPEE